MATILFWPQCVKVKLCWAANKWQWFYSIGGTGISQQSNPGGRMENHYNDDATICKSHKTPNRCNTMNVGVLLQVNCFHLNNNKH